jgi:hypothetical protein
MNHTRDTYWQNAPRQRRTPGSQLVPKEFEKVMSESFQCFHWQNQLFIFQSDCDRALALAVADQGYVIRSVQTDELD